MISPLTIFFGGAVAAKFQFFMPTKIFPDNFPTTTNIFLFSSFFGLFPFEEIERENEVDDDGDKEDEGEEKGPCPLLFLPL